MIRPRRAKRSIRDISIPLLYVVAAVLALVWSVLSYGILAPNVEQLAPTNGVLWGFLVAFLAGFAGAAAIVTGAYLLAEKIKET